MRTSCSMSRLAVVVSGSAVQMPGLMLSLADGRSTGSIVGIPVLHSLRRSIRHSGQLTGMLSQMVSEQDLLITAWFVILRISFLTRRRRFTLCEMLVRVRRGNEIP